MSEEFLSSQDELPYYSVWQVCTNPDLSDYGSSSIALCLWGANATFDEAVRSANISANMYETEDYVVQLREEHGSAFEYTVVSRDRWRRQIGVRA